MFLDLNGENVIGVDEIMKGNLIGRGAFGFVFKATLSISDEEPRSVAMKMLQPVQPGIRTGKVSDESFNILISGIQIIFMGFLSLVFGNNS